MPDHLCPQVWGGQPTHCGVRADRLFKWAARKAVDRHLQEEKQAAFHGVTAVVQPLAQLFLASTSTTGQPVESFEPTPLHAHGGESNYGANERGLF